MERLGAHVAELGHQGFASALDCRRKIRVSRIDALEVSLPELMVKGGHYRRLVHMQRSGH
jgi:hypothetical protein